MTWCLGCSRVPLLWDMRTCCFQQLAKAQLWLIAVFKTTRSLKAFYASFTVYSCEGLYIGGKFLVKPCVCAYRDSKYWVLVLGTGLMFICYCVKRGYALFMQERKYLVLNKVIRRSSIDSHMCNWLGILIEKNWLSDALRLCKTWKVFSLEAREVRRYSNVSLVMKNRSFPALLSFIEDVNQYSYVFKEI